ncbi:hypothetical protein M513_14027 [Trichuris suis]|uniref:Uncharacterized protein n=1 Tax=Trichuris suis TaxID=68888 RepID=A0A085LJF1_9BILA|nr:hypothetical protein M513_14027 [Trichuris suis]
MPGGHEIGKIRVSYSATMRQSPSEVVSLFASIEIDGGRVVCILVSSVEFVMIDAHLPEDLCIMTELVLRTVLQPINAII